MKMDDKISFEPDMAVDPDFHRIGLGIDGLSDGVDESSRTIA